MSACQHRKQINEEKQANVTLLYNKQLKYRAVIRLEKTNQCCVPLGAVSGHPVSMISSWLAASLATCGTSFRNGHLVTRVPSKRGTPHVDI